MSAYTLEYSSESFSQLRGLDKQIANRIIKKLERTMESPHMFFKRLTGRPEYKLRVGDYRVIADIDDAKRVIFIRSMGHRKNTYARP